MAIAGVSPAWCTPFLPALLKNRSVLGQRAGFRGFSPTPPAVFPIAGRMLGGVWDGVNLFDLLSPQPSDLCSSGLDVKLQRSDAWLKGR